MLSVPTLWTVFVINFLALGLIWAYVIHSYPSFAAARFWAGSSFAAWLQVVVWTATIVGTIVDTLVLIWRTKRELRRRFPDENRRGAVTYAVLRSSQLRRLRLPKPQVSRGATLPDCY